MKHEFQYTGTIHTIEIHSSGDETIAADSGREIRFTLRDLGNDQIELRLPERTIRLYAVADGETRWIAYGGRTYELTHTIAARARRPGGGEAAGGVLRAPMPGQVRSVEVGVGDAVTKGQTLLLLEAMKMEIRIQAPHDGTVAALPVAAGEQVEREQVLVEIE
jgi:biotin carboxyl carrier protein